MRRIDYASVLFTGKKQQGRKKKKVSNSFKGSSSRREGEGMGFGMKCARKNNPVKKRKEASSGSKLMGRAG